MAKMVDVMFRVQVATEPGYTVFAVGNNQQLGQWDPHQALLLSRDTNDIWACCVQLPSMLEVQYRYFIGRIQQTHSGCIVEVFKWEANIKPRILIPKECTEDPRKFASGTAVFGNYDDSENIVNDGWLTDQTEIHLELKDNPIHMWKACYRDQTYRVKCTALDYLYTSNGSISVQSDGKEEDEDFDEDPAFVPSTFSKVLVAVLRDGYSLKHTQPELGEIHKKDDFLLFTTQSINPQSLGFQLDFYVHYDHKAPKHVGYSYILPADLVTSKETKVIPITGLKHKPIGQLTVSYFVVKPVEDLKMKMDVSYQKYWKSEGRSVDVGHRGMGSSYKHKKLSVVRENTITSLQSAGSHGADYVEFDVMLSKDLVPVVYHDFHVCITYRKKKKEHELLKLGVKDLSLSELQSMKLADKTALLDQDHDIDGEDLDPANLQPFPTLKECFQKVDQKVGFNVEVKFPQQQVDGVWEETNFWDRNLYVDIVLKCTFEHADQRNIIFSSFDPETCLMLRLKQNKYPVLFLTNGGAKCYTPYSDLREQSIPMAIYFAQFSDIMGIDVCAEVLCTNPEYIKMTKDKGLVLFSWGEDNNNTDTINKLRSQGVDGIIYDRIDFFKSGSEMQDNVFKMKKQLLKQLDVRNSGIKGPVDCEDSTDSEYSSDGCIGNINRK